jgi:hypothetical protein
MDSPEPFKNLKLDTWYKAVMYLGGFAFILSLVISVKGLTNSQLELLSGGAFLFGLGEWKNHKVKSAFKPPNAYTGPAGILEWTERSPDAVGMLFDIVGVGLIGLSILRIIRGR